MTAYLGQSTLKLFSLLICLLCGVSCAYPGSVGAPRTIKIGLVAPFEGLDRPLGYEALFGVKLAVQERNRGDGLRGYRIELVALNDFNDPDQARMQARALIADPDILGVVGHLGSTATLAALPLYDQANLAVSSPWTIKAASLEGDHTGVVTIAASDVETEARLEVAGQRMGFDHLSKLTDHNINDISGKVEALQLATDAVTGGEIILALQQAGLTMPLFGQVDIGSPQLIQVAESAADGLVFVSPGPDPYDIAGAGAFIEAYQSLAGFPPGPRAVLAYDATQVLLDAIEQVIAANNRQPARLEVSTVITSVQRQGLSGPIAFDAQGRRINAPVWVYQISGGRYPGVPITP